MKKINAGQILGILLILGSVLLIFMMASQEDAVVVYRTPKEVLTKPQQFENRRFKIGGMVLGGTKKWDAKAQHLTFRLTDLKGSEFHVDFKGIPPDMFKEAQGVIVDGVLLSQEKSKHPSLRTLEAKTLMVKHAEGYDTTQHGKHIDRDKLNYEAIFGKGSSQDLKKTSGDKPSEKTKPGTEASQDVGTYTSDALDDANPGEKDSN